MNGFDVIRRSPLRLAMLGVVTSLAVVATVLSLVDGPLDDRLGLVLTMPAQIFVITWAVWCRRHRSTDRTRRA